MTCDILLYRGGAGEGIRNRRNTVYNSAVCARVCVRACVCVLFYSQARCLHVLYVVHRQVLNAHMVLLMYFLRTDSTCFCMNFPLMMS